MDGGGGTQLFRSRLLSIVGLLFVCSFLGLTAGAPTDTRAAVVPTPSPGNYTPEIVGEETSAKLNQTSEMDVQVADYPKTNPVQFRVEISNRKVNAGDLLGQRMYDAVYKCLEEICPYDHGFCDSNKHSKNNCPIRADEFTRFSFRVTAAYWPSGYKRLREEMLDLIAFMLKSITSNDKNCHQVNNSLHRGTVCNIPANIFISLDHWYGKDHELHRTEATPYIEVAIAQDGKWHGWDGGPFDCVGSLTPINNYINRFQQGTRQSSLIERIGRIIGEPSSAIKQNVYCPHPGVTRRDVGLPEPNRLSKRANAPKQKVTISIGTRKQNIGTWKFEEAWKKIYDCLSTLCPFGSNGNNNHDMCWNNRKCWIDNVPRVDKNKINYDHKIALTAGVSYFPRGQHGLREIFLDQAAAVFAAFTDDSRNCYDRMWGVHTYQFCNVPQLVFIHVGDVAWLWIELAYDHDNVLGEIDCANTKESQIAPRFTKDKRQAWANALNLKDKSDMGLYIECQGAKQYDKPSLFWEFDRNFDVEG
ncbi:hypothetical protein DM02DRAFT_661033 [Periconia macrospinosa]|uniref:Uncharacterized protein n=1 Tax=Periconia macrospinosa TaxID=97972 RepID=A0A2V1DA88_9PLEO|nr:hypothetical protein DM02DRAFT_661033 [Periconia macrospinosa]